jgi:tetratricopeptide (TPR) repeat protein
VLVLFVLILVVAQANAGPLPDVATSSGLKDDLVEIYLDAGTRASFAGYKEDAEQLLRSALRLADAGKLETLTVSRVLDSLGKIAEDQGKVKEADRYYQRANQVVDKVLGNDSSSALKGREALAAFYHRTGQYAEMEAVLRGSLQRVWKNAGPQPAGGGLPAIVKQAPVVIPSLQQLAECFRMQKKFHDAEDTYLNLLTQIKEQQGTDNALMAQALYNLGSLYHEEDKFAEAEKFLLSSLAVIDKTLGHEHASTILPLRALAELKRELGQFSEAEQFFTRYITWMDKSSGGKSAVFAHVLIDAGEFELGLGNLEQATSYLTRARDIIEKVEGKEDRDMAQLLRAQGRCLIAQSRFAEAETVIKQARALSEKLSGAKDLSVGYSLELLGDLYTAQGKLPDAETCFKQSLAIEEQFAKQAPVRVAEDLEAYAKLLEKLDRSDDAGKQSQRAKELRAQMKQPVQTGQQ